MLARRARTLPTQCGSKCKVWAEPGAPGRWGRTGMKTRQTERKLDKERMGVVARKRKGCGIQRSKNLRRKIQVSTETFFTKASRRLNKN